MAEFQSGCLNSLVRNSSGTRRTFSFLPPHGRTLEADEELIVKGDVREAVARLGGQHSERRLDAFERAIRDGHLEIVKTPSPIYQDTSTGEPRMVVVADGIAHTEGACWTSESVSEGD